MGATAGFMLAYQNSCGRLMGLRVRPFLRTVFHVPTCRVHLAGLQVSLLRHSGLSHCAASARG